MVFRTAENTVLQETFRSETSEVIEPEPFQVRGGVEGFGLRADDTPKGRGFFGPIALPGGGVATEFSIGVEFDGVETQIPTLVPTLTDEEFNLLTTDIIPNRKKVPESIVRKSVEHARGRISQGQSPFKQEGEDVEIAESPGLFSRAVKGFINKVILDPLGVIKQRGFGGLNVELESLKLLQEQSRVFNNLSKEEFDKLSFKEQLALPEPPLSPEDEILNLQTIDAQAKQNVAERVTRFEVPKAETVPEKIVEVGSSVAAFIGRLAVTREILGVQPGDFVGSVVAWETENIATGGTPGRGAAMRLALGGIDIIPATTLVGKTGQLGAKSALFGGLAAAAGGDKEDIIIASLIPLAFAAWNKAGREVRKGRAKRAIAIVRKDAAAKGLDLKGVPDQSLQTVIDLSKDAKFWNTELAKGRITPEVHGQRLSEIRNRVSPILDSVARQQKKPSVEKAAIVPTEKPPEPTPVRPAAPPVAEVPAKAPIIPPKAPEAAVEPIEAEVPKPPVAKEVEVTEQDLLTERREIKKIPQVSRTPQQIERIAEIEDELVKRRADEFPDVDISPKARKAETQKVRNQILGHGVYQAELEAAENVPNLSGTFAVDSTEIGDIRQRFEGRPELLKKFVLRETGGRRWDEAAAESTDVDRFDDFVDLVEIFVESQKTGRGLIDATTLARALNSGDPSIELFALKHDMLKNGFTAAEINKELTEFAKRENLGEEFIKPELIPFLFPAEGAIDVAKKQTILRELDKTFRKVEKRKVAEPEKVAIDKARAIAAKNKRPMFVVERQGKFSITRKRPTKGKFIKVTPPEAGEIVGKTERLRAGPTQEEIKEAKLLRQRINIAQKKKGLTKKEFSDLKLKHGGSRRLTGARPRSVEQLKAVLKAVERARPRVIGHKKVVSLKTENQIAELRKNLTDLEFMNDDEFQIILEKEARGKQAKFVDAKNFITQKEGREILNRMHDTAQRLRVTEPIRRAIEKSPDVKAEIAKIDKLPTKAKDPSRLKSMRFFYQRLGEQSGQPIYEVFLDLTLEEQLRSRERHNVTKLAEKLPDFAKIANDPKALQRIEDWIVAQSVLKDRPESPKDITNNELRLAKLVQASFESYETLARAGKFFEFFDNRQEMPQYLQFKQGIDKAFDVYNTKGYDALIKYLDTQDWGIVSAGYSPMESVVRKVSTHRMPDVGVGKGRIRQRGITYRKQDRDILQRWYSYMRQMDQLVHIQPRIKSLVRLINDSQASFANAQRTNNVVSTYLDNLKHTNYEDGLIEEFSRRLYSQAITVRVLADPLKVFRNLAQNAAFSEDRRDFLDPRNKKLTAEDVEYLETHVQQASVMMTDWAYVGEDPFVFKRLTKWVQRKTLYPSSDRVNRLISFHAKINRVRRAFATDKPLAKKMKAARFSDMQKTEQRTALSILTKDGIDPMARFIAKVHTDNTHFLYAREQRSPAEQTKLGRIALNLALFRRAALEKALFQLGKIFQRGTGFGAKLRAANVLVTLLGMSALVGVLWKKLTGQKYSPYSYFNFLELNFGGLELATIEKAEEAYNSMLAIITLDPKKAGKAIDAFGTNIASVADYMIPFYDIGLRAIEATIGSENIDRVPARKLRELIDKEYKSRGLTKINRSLVEKIQFTFAKGGVGEQKKSPTGFLIIKEPQ